jgi:3',5'-cyclic AMP phosphodiesterase CpdA
MMERNDRTGYMVLRKFSLLLVFLCALVRAQAADKLVGGPFVVNASSRTATIVWILQTSDVKLGTSPNDMTRIAPVLRPEKVTLSSLDAGKTYYYDVLGRAEGTGSFKTAPVGPAKFKFVVYGDTRTRHDMHRKVVEAINRTDPDFVLHTGDLVADGRDTSQWPIFFSIEEQLLRKTAFFPVLGNHERNDPQFHEFFDVRTPYYSFDWGTSHFVILNSDFGNVAASPEAKKAFWAEQERWLEEDLQNSQSADFRFVTFHHPPFTAMKRRQGGNKPVREWVPLFEKYHVSAVFNGHDHNYQHHYKDGVHYIVTGGGGAPLYALDSPIPGVTQKVERAEHFVEVEVDGKQARILAIGLDGSLIDSIDLKH